eukprot:jgi/Mesvir1/21763/Mv04167-RA.1
MLSKTEANLGRLRTSFCSLRASRITKSGRLLQRSPGNGTLVHSRRAHRAGTPVQTCALAADRGSIPVLEHVVLLRVRASTSPEDEQQMMDRLYGTQYLYPKVLSLTIGPNIAKQSTHGFTHGMFVRLPSTAALADFYRLPSQRKTFEDYVLPFVEEIWTFSYESRVENDIGPIFRRGDEWDTGVDHVTLYKAPETASEETRQLLVTHLLAASGAGGGSDSPDILQATAGRSVAEEASASLGGKHGFTHGVTVRLGSEADLNMHLTDASRSQLLSSQVLPHTEQQLEMSILVAPVGTGAKPF